MPEEKEVMGLDFTHLERLEVPRRPQLYTAGYTGKKPAMLLAVAERLGAVIVDIRYKPFSRAPMWTRASMQRVWGERYVYVHSLGNVNYKGGEVIFQDLETGLRTVRSMLLGSQPQLLPEFLRSEPGVSVILLCGCMEVANCHRRLAAEAIAARMGIEWRELTHEDIMGVPLESSKKKARGGRGGSGAGSLIQPDMFR